MSLHQFELNATYVQDNLTLCQYPHTMFGCMFLVNRRLLFEKTCHYLLKETCDKYRKWKHFFSDVRFVHLPLHTDRKSTRLNSSHVSISYAVFCLKKKQY